jgi:hypothetical protein
MASIGAIKLHLVKFHGAVECERMLGCPNTALTHATREAIQTQDNSLLTRFYAGDFGG